MNKKQFAKIVSLHNAGVDSHTCVVAILQMVCGYENSSVAFRTAAEDIDKFYKDIVYEGNTPTSLVNLLVDQGWTLDSAEEFIKGGNR